MQCCFDKNVETIISRAWFLVENYINFYTYTLIFFSFLFFSIRVFFHGHWRLTGQQGKGGDHFLFHSTTSTRSRTFRDLFAALHVGWLSHIFNWNACIYQTATCWGFPTLLNYHLIDWWCEVCCSLFIWWFDTRFLLQRSWYGKPVDSNTHWLTLVLQANRLTKCASVLTEFDIYLISESNLVTLPNPQFRINDD